MGLLLPFLYTDRMDFDRLPIADDAKSLSDETQAMARARQAIEWSVFFCLPELQAQAEAYIIRHCLNLDTCVSLLIVADDGDLPDLAQRSLDMLIENFAYVGRSIAF